VRIEGLKKEAREELAVRRNGMNCDSVDLAFFGFPEPRLNTVPLTFTVAADSSEHIAELVILASSVGAGRPNTMHIAVGGMITTLEDPLGGNDDELLIALIDIVTKE
jgi:hypothetical protein